MLFSMAIIQKLNFNEKPVHTHSVSKFSNNLDQSSAGALLTGVVCVCVCGGDLLGKNSPNCIHLCVKVLI